MRPVTGVWMFFSVLLCNALVIITERGLRTAFRPQALLCGLRRVKLKDKFPHWNLKRIMSEMIPHVHSPHNQ